MARVLLPIAVCALLGALLVAALPAPGHAAPLRFAGTLTIELLPGLDLPRLETTAAGEVPVSGDGSFALAGGLFAGTLQTVITGGAMTAPLTIAGSNAAGAFGPPAGTGTASLFFGGRMPFPGAVTFASNFLPVQAPLTLVGGTGTFPFEIGPSTLSVPAVAWRTGTSMFLDARSSPVTLVALDARTPAGLGTLQMIAPVVVPDPFAAPAVAGAGEPFAILLGTLTVEFTAVPEPTSGALFALGLLSLAAGARRRRRAA